MSLRPPFAVALLMAGLRAGPAGAAAPAPDELQQLRLEIDQLRRGYESRLQALEERLKQAESAAQRAPASPPASAATVAPPAPAPSRSAAASAGSFNPAVSLILSGQYARLSRDPDGYRIAGFAAADDIGPGSRGFNLGETELAISASIDPMFYGALTLALGADDSVGVEEGFVQTTALPAGLTLKFGRFFSGIGYLNEKHAHSWDFADNPLAYQAFLGTQFKQDGLQLRWLAPTDRFLQFTAELGSGGSFPGARGEHNGAGAAALAAHTGGDFSLSSSWRAGLSVLRASPRERESADTDLAGTEVSNAFSGRSSVWIADAIWKWAPNGNAQRTNLTLQGEYFRRRERGTLVYDVAGAASAGRHASAQSGWYAQGVYQFMPRWRAGLRVDRLDAGSVDFGANAASLAGPGFDPRRVAAMLDWSPSEFSRVRLQVASERARLGGSDRQIFLQYQMSLGAHGGHSY